MPRKQRIEYPGAIYHVISRGNYRKELFLRQNTGEAFERCLFEVVDRCGWKLHAYVIMSNHFHLVVETPEPNLVVGMKWLQSTFATRFNRLRKERGLFSRKLKKGHVVMFAISIWNSVFFSSPEFLKIPT
jgi:REP element-mobilizing transposase RayT